MMLAIYATILIIYAAIFMCNDCLHPISGSFQKITARIIQIISYIRNYSKACSYKTV